MATYSHSRISTFEQCRYKYKLQYIDKIKVDIPTTIEAFMGDIVHQSLEKLHSDLKYQKLLSKEEVIDFYNALWDEEWDDKILIVKKDYTKDNYKSMGQRYINDYYTHFTPFDQMKVLGLETQDIMLLPDGNHYHVRIDKLGCKGDTYFVCDYKTNSSMKTQEEADKDRQLAMYSIWVKDRYKDAKKVFLLWYMLAFDKTVVSTRNETDLEKLQTETVTAIKKIEECKEYPLTITNLCSYCVFQGICPAFVHQNEIETKIQGQKSLADFSNVGKKEIINISTIDDNGVKLVDDYSKLELEKEKIEEKIEKMKEKLIEFSKLKNAQIIYGTEKKLSIKEYETISYEDKEKLLELLKQKGLYEEYSMISYPKLNSKVLKNEIDKEIIKLSKKEKDYRLSLSKK